MKSLLNITEDLRMLQWKLIQFLGGMVDIWDGSRGLKIWDEIEKGLLKKHLRQPRKKVFQIVYIINILNFPQGWDGHSIFLSQYFSTWWCKAQPNIRMEKSLPKLYIARPAVPYYNLIVVIEFVEQWVGLWGNISRPKWTRSVMWLWSVTMWVRRCSYRNNVSSMQGLGAKEIYHTWSCWWQLFFLSEFRFSRGIKMGLVVVMCRKSSRIFKFMEKALSLAMGSTDSEA